MSVELKIDIQISIIIPVKNGDKWIANCIRAIIDQTLFSSTEIIVLDSGSTDSTLEILKEFPVKVITISPNEFNHGLTRNLGVQHAVGKYIVMTVQDARAADEKWLEKLMEGFVDETVAGVCGQQVVPHETDKNPVDWFRPYSKPTLVKYSYSQEEFENLTPFEKKRTCGWDNVNAMYRRDILLEVPFQKIVFGEDALWAKQVLIKGYTITYNYSARVYHYHHENFDFVFKRMLTAFYLQYRAFGYKPNSTLVSSRRKIGIIKTLLFRSPGISVLKVPFWVKYNMVRWRAMNKAKMVFFDALKNGEDELDKVHEKYCGKPPIPLKS